MDTRTLTAKIKEIAEEISKMSKGTLLTHINLSEMLEVNWKDQKYGGRILRLKKELMEKYGYYLVVEHKVGYKIAEEGKEIDVCAGKCEGAVKRYVSGVKEMNNIRIDQIRDEHKKNKTIRLAQDYANKIGLLKLGGSQKVIR